MSMVMVGLGGKSLQNRLIFFVFSLANLTPIHSKLPLHILRLKRKLKKEYSIKECSILYLLSPFRLGKRSISDQNYIISLVRKLQKTSLDKNSPEKINQDLVEKNKTKSSEDLDRDLGTFIYLNYQNQNHLINLNILIHFTLEQGINILKKTTSKKNGGCIFII
jgi:hypothetical protein